MWSPVTPKATSPQLPRTDDTCRTCARNATDSRGVTIFAHGEGAVARFCAACVRERPAMVRASAAKWLEARSPGH